MAASGRSGGRVGGFSGGSRSFSGSGMSGSRSFSAPRTTTIVHSTPSVSFGIMPVMPFGGWGWGWGMGGYHSSGNGLVTLMLVAFMAWAAITVFNNFNGAPPPPPRLACMHARGRGRGRPPPPPPARAPAPHAARARRRPAGRRAEYGDEDFTEEPPVSVARLQVGLLSSARALKAELNTLASRADTSRAAGLQMVLQVRAAGQPAGSPARPRTARCCRPRQPPAAAAAACLRARRPPPPTRARPRRRPRPQETVLALLRHPEYCVYADSASEVVAGPEEAEQRFGALSLQERRKFGAETLSNYGGLNRSGSYSAKASLTEVDELLVGGALRAARLSAPAAPAACWSGAC
jgi:hypothetical protein